jgi:cobalt-zinc-cadmium efflux system outer membrane protein
LLALVQTYRLFETAAYRRERLRVATELAEFNDKLFQALKRRLEVNPASAADVALAEVELEATRQLVEAARNDYAVALTDFHNQIGTPETAGQALPSDPFVAPADMVSLDEGTLISLAVQSRPEIQSARAGVAGALAVVKLAKGDRIPTPVLGPVYERDQAGVQYAGFVAIVPIPIVNNGTPLVRQREAEYRRAAITLQQIEQRTVTQVKAAAAKWNQAKKLVERTAGLTKNLQTQVKQIERLFEANQTDLTKLLQARQRLIQLENAELDAVWQATQAHADLMTALGVPHLIHGLLNPSQTGTAPPAEPTAPSAALATPVAAPR